MIEFNGKTVWITGGSSGIGKALALKFSSLGANLVISSRNPDQLNLVAKQCNENTLVLTLDLGDSSNFSKKVDVVLKRLRQLIF